jgi:hypothetical protein
VPIKKTFKREIAVALLLWLAYVVEVKDVSVVEVIIWPIFAFLGAAFGLDAYSKQLQQRFDGVSNGGRTQDSSEYPSGENRLPDDRNHE